MKVFIKRPGENPEAIEIDNELEALQEAVGGYIECLTYAREGRVGTKLYPGVVVICNEEGRLNGMPYNCHVRGIGHLYGPLLFVGYMRDEFVDFPMNEGAGRLYLKSIIQEETT